METIRFDELNLDPRILRAVTDMGFEAASPIQAQAIPVEMEGHDMIGQAQTGTGKTAAFGIPLLMKMDPENRKTQAMILCPTRELAIQVAEGKKYVLLNAPKDKMDEIIEVLPGMKSPTITPLADGNWVSVQSVIAEKHFWEIIGKLKSLGAEGILVLPIEKMIL